MKAKTNSTVDADEIERFSRMAGEWWNPEGKFKPLHRINPLRIQWVVDQAISLKGLRLLDIGCGGGLIAEPMARLGASVTAIDAAQESIAAAKLHAQQSGLEIDYRCMAVEELSAQCTVLSAEKKENSELTTQHSALFDIVLALEIVEHVADVEAFVAASCALLKPGGLILYSTLNRTAKSFALGIVCAEYVLGWVPRGTHDWKKFLKPSELCKHLRHNNIEVTEMTGMVMNPLTLKWELDAKDLSVNYLVAGRRIPA